MRQQTFSNRVETALGMPDRAPKAVEKAYEKFRGLVEKLEPITAERKQCEAEIPVRIDGGKRIADPTRSPAAFKAFNALPVLQEKEAAILAKIDAAGDEWARAVDAARDTWLADARTREAADLAAFNESVADARRALNRLADTRGSIAWLTEWKLHPGPEPDSLIATVDTSYRGPRVVLLDIGATRHFDNPGRATDVLDMLRNVLPFGKKIKGAIQ